MEKNTKKKRGCLMPLIILLIIAVGLSILVKNTPNYKETLPSSTPEEVAARWLEFDEKSWADFSNLFISHSKFVDAMNKYADGKVTQVDFYDYCKKVEEYFRNASTNLNYGQNQEEKDYLKVMVSMALSDQIAAKSIMKYLNDSTVKDLSTGKDNIALAKEAAEMIAGNRGLLLVKAGLTDDEIKTKVEEDMAKLEDALN